MKKLIALILAALLALSALPALAAGEEAAEEAAATEFNYVPDEDLLLAEGEGVKVWLVGEKPSDYGEYDEYSGGYPWYSFRIENDRDESVVPRFRLTMEEERVLYSGSYHEFDAHSAEEEQFNLFSSEKSVGGIENYAEFAQLTDVTFAISLEKDYERTPLADLGTVTVHFEPAEEALEDGVDIDTSATLEDFLGSWRLTGVSSASGPYKSAEEVGTDLVVVIETGRITYVHNGEPDVGDEELTVRNGVLYNAYGRIGAMLTGGEFMMGDSSRVFMYFQREGGTAEPEEVESAETTEGEAASANPDQVYTDKPTVKAAQQALNDAGYSTGTPDGIAGKKTAAAITQYQTDNGLAATGTVTEELLASLGLR